MKRLSTPQIIGLHSALISEFGGVDGIRDEGLLESAIGAPFQTFAGQSLYPSIIQKAVRLGFGLTRNHPFIDGNKRTGAHVMLTFLAVNGIELDYTQEELSDIFLSIASGESGYEDLLFWVVEHQL